MCIRDSTGGVQQLQNGQVPTADRVVLVRALTGDREQRPGLVGLEHPGQAPVPPGGGEPRCV